MNRNKVLLISILMGIALIGLIILQVNWIRHDFLLRQERFTAQTKEALNKAINKLETKASVHFITNELNEFLEDSMSVYFRNAGLPEIPEVGELSEVTELIDSRSGATSVTYVTHYEDSTFNRRIEIISEGDEGPERVVVSVNADTKVQAVKVKQHQIELKKAEEELKEVHKKLSWEQDHIRRRATRIDSVLQKMELEYKQREEVLLERIVPETLDSLIRLELIESDINLPYGIELRTGKSDSLIWSRSIGNDIDALNYTTVNAKLFPDDIISSNDMVSILFPDTFRYFLSSMWLMLISSGLFTFIIIFAFSYTIHVIFRQKKLSEMKNDFINNMTHEFKTPIATIRLAADALNNAEVRGNSEKMNYYTSIIRSENDRMNSQVENILQIAQFDKSSFINNPEKTDMHEVIRKVVMMMELHAVQKGGTIRFHPEAPEYFVIADRKLIPIVLNNLLDNAIKYSVNAPDIDVRTCNRDGNLVITVSDKGIGMSADTQEKIFDKFYRVPSGDIHNVKGFGLGLSYVKAIVTAHGGTIKVESEEGRGSQFEIMIPLWNNEK